MKPVVAVPAVMTGFSICYQTVFVALHPKVALAGLEFRRFEARLQRGIRGSLP
jgi:hypothetical protein